MTRYLWPLALAALVAALFVAQWSSDQDSATRQQVRDARCRVERAHQRDLLRRVAATGEPVDIARALAEPEACGP